MSTLGIIWNIFLYQPLFNALIWIYNTFAGENLGWAVVWLTIFLRIVLLPLNLIAESTGSRNQKAHEEAEKAIKAYKGDPVAQKEEARRIMRKYHVSPWAKALMLGVQLLVLILLYQVFIRGITNDRVAKILYQSVDFPGVINTNFYGFEIGRAHDWIWAGMAAFYLFCSIIVHNRGESKMERSEAIYTVLFPVFTFAILWYLPMVKSLFILTTMVFSDSVSLLRWAIVSTFTSKKDDGHGANAHGVAHH